MATIKSFTSLEQSKKLAEMLSLESADMGYLWNGTSFCEYPVSNKTIFNRTENIPCWSLAALLNAIPGGQVSKMTESNKWEASSWNDSDFEPQICVEGFDNPVDACVAMIEKLNELKML